MICKVDCAFSESLRTNTVTPASSLKNSATYKWFSKAYVKFEEKLSDEFTEREINEISDSLSANVDGGKIETIASLFQTLFRYWCSNMKVSRRVDKNNTNVECFDTECSNVKKEKFKFLNLFSETGYQYIYKNLDSFVINSNISCDHKPKVTKHHYVNRLKSQLMIKKVSGLWL